MPRRLAGRNEEPRIFRLQAEALTTSPTTYQIVEIFDPVFLH